MRNYNLKMRKDDIDIITCIERLALTDADRNRTLFQRVAVGIFRVADCDGLVIGIRLIQKQLIGDTVLCCHIRKELFCRAAVRILCIAEEFDRHGVAVAECLGSAAVLIKQYRENSAFADQYAFFLCLERTVNAVTAVISGNLIDAVRKVCHICRIGELGCCFASDSSERDRICFIIKSALDSKLHCPVGAIRQDVDADVSVSAASG